MKKILHSQNLKNNIQVPKSNCLTNTKRHFKKIKSNKLHFKKNKFINKIKKIQITIHF